MRFFPHGTPTNEVLLLVFLFIIVPALYPAACFTCAGLIWRRRHYWKKRWMALAIVYVVSLAVGVFGMFHRDADGNNLALVAWSTFSLMAGSILWFPPSNPPRQDCTLCPICSYDLRAHAPGDKCPECGTPISKV